MRNTCRVNLPSFTAVKRSGSIVSRPGKPGGGSLPVFSSIVWGAKTESTLKYKDRN